MISRMGHGVEGRLCPRWSPSGKEQGLPLGQASRRLGRAPPHSLSLRVALAGFSRSGAKGTEHTSTHIWLIMRVGSGDCGGWGVLDLTLQAGCVGGSLPEAGNQGNQWWELQSEDRGRDVPAHAALKALSPLLRFVFNSGPQLTAQEEHITAEGKGHPPMQMPLSQKHLQTHPETMLPIARHPVAQPSWHIPSVIKALS